MLKPKTPRPSSSSVSRRGFLNLFLGSGVAALLGAVLYPIVRFVIPPKQPEAATTRVVAARVGDLALNSGKIFRFGKEPVLLILLASGEYRAFQATCTHLDCNVQYRPDLGHIWCACHNGHYDLNGKNIAGPPPEPLAQFDVTVRGDQIIVTKA